jgi:rod shape determining protein RodA
MSDQKNQSRIDYDFVLFGSTIALMIIGILFIYSSGINSDGLLVSNEFVKQIIWASLGVGLLLLFSFLDYARLKDYSAYIYGGFILILIYTRIFGKVVNGARSWLNLVGDFGIQPSEFMKIAAIIFLARFLTDSKRNMSDFSRLGISCAIIGVPMLLILSQPDFGTSIVFIPILLFMMFIAGIKASYLIYIALTVAATGFLTILPLWQKFILKQSLPIFQVFTTTPYCFILLAVILAIFGLALWGFLTFKKKYYYWIAYLSSCLGLSMGASLLAHKVLQEYQIKRLIVFLDPNIEGQKSGWNIIQSLTAIGSGGLFGKGFLQGTQSHYQYLPQQSTDFIFSIIAEEIGFFGCLVIFGLFLAILWRCLYIVKNVKDDYGVLIAAGVSAMVFFHFIVNVGMAMAIMPITGIPLLFLSYGGSSLWAALLGIGLVLSVYIRRFRH